MATASVSDQQGNTLGGLASYRVTVNVSDSTVGATAVRRVGVQVTHQNAGIDIRIAGYRANL